jgi:acyl-CoA thioester hydrolase
MASSFFSVDMPVRYRDTDSQGHLYFANYLVLADEALGLYWRELGLPTDNMDAMPCMTFAVNAQIDYRNESLAHDVLTISVGFSRLGNSSADSRFVLVNKRTGECAAEGSFTHVFVDKTTRKSCPIPTSFRSAIVSRQGELASV